MKISNIQAAHASFSHIVSKVVFVAALLVLTSAVPQAQAMPIQSGLVAHYAFEGAGQTVVDGVAPSQNGVLGISSGNATNDPTRTTGFIGNGLDFENGTAAQFVTLPGSDQFVTGTSVPLSIAGWVNVESFGAGIVDNRVFTLEHSSNGSTFSLSVGNGVGSSGQLTLGYNDTTTFLSTAANSTFNTGAWHHVAATYDGSTVRFYLDGNPDGTIVTPIRSTGTPIAAIGAFPTGSSPYDGLMDDLGVWSRALDPEEISLIYQNGLLGIDLANAAAFAAPIPEPSTMILLGLGCLGINRIRRRRKS